MVFSSPVFLFLFLPAVYVIYRLLPGIRSRNVFLALASLVFYSFGQLEYLPLFLLSVIINWASGLALLKLEKGRRAVLTAAVIANLGILAYFKYTDFAIFNFNQLFGSSVPLKNIVLPIGISFFTFQGMSYVIDVYRDRSSGTESFLKILLYISFFPQLIAGPIVKYHDISQQIDLRNESPAFAAAGIRRFICGLGKKVIIANTAGMIADRVFDEFLPASQVDVRIAWLGAVCYSLQIYFDFSGYSDMAIGIGRMFGFKILENFDHPYGSGSIREFWRKWHISLSTWFREYLYVPLGGNRRGKLRTVINRMLVFLCTGIWHGANWTFIVWGVCHGILSDLEGAGVIPVEKMKKTAAGRVINRIYTMLAVILLFVIFRADSLASGWKLICAMFTPFVSSSAGFELRMMLSPASVFVLMIAVILSGNIPGRVQKACEGALTANPQVFEAILSALSIVLLALCAMSLAHGGFNPFIYFQF